jgi:hypothetical protein
VNYLVTTTDRHHLISVEPLAVGVCVLVVAQTRLLLPGVTSAVVLVAVARGLGVA